MDLSIIILNYKQKGLVKYCLKNLLALSLPFKFEIIVVDNASGDGTAEMIKSEFFGVRLIQAEENRGYAAGNNLGIKAAQGKYLLILNPDLNILSGAALKLHQFMENHPQACLVGPKILNPDGSLQYTCSRFPDWRLPFFRRTFLSRTKAGQKWNEYYLMTDWDHQSNRPVDWLFGACLMVRKSALEKVGLLDERFFLYMEDLDWCRRTWEQGLEVWYAAEAEVIHYHQRLSAEVSIFWSLFSKTARLHLFSWLKYFFKYSGKDLPKGK
ncbi:MAG: hypothetical protein A2927_01790 [Candidatus Komeilibacteria bacterium RIFCSPLOWO2_01_FULL_45_10]|uniref:Glycosyltransferase 2-like domain-containing protein n=1 Tax=Candidatus Komeilibacteria bacterium RIFCSPLOWO2_01_FULL_45_10 TaxID=1798550 RepID=A0A1G2BHE3_9BACT|nr:MAG: hypothetical protein A2927_01790 [Candidatus Komeilibacteria bacterium RIFCSPLOWO2_01_FULL_45_10]